MSNPTTPFSWQMPTATDLVTDLPADFEVFGQAVATSMADLLGGTTGQILSKATNADMDFTWVSANPGDITGVTAGVGMTGGGTSGTVTLTNDMATTITASGDIVVGTGSGTYDNLPIGTTDQVLTADTTVSPYKVKWATPAAPASGLTFIKKETIGTGVSSIAVSSAFSSTYDNYRVEISFTSGNFSGDIYFRFGSTIVGYYGNNIDMSPNSATVTGASINNADSIPLCLINSTNGGNVSMDIMSPNLAKRSSVTAAGVGFNTTGNSQRWTNAYENSNTQHTAFTVLVGNTLTGGEIRVYGYQNS
jgi:hypothetical protein